VFELGALGFKFTRRATGCLRRGRGRSDTLDFGRGPVVISGRPPTHSPRPAGAIGASGPSRSPPAVFVVTQRPQSHTHVSDDLQSLAIQGCEVGRRTNGDGVSTPSAQGNSEEGSSPSPSRRETPGNEFVERLAFAKLPADEEAHLLARKMAGFARSLTSAFHATLRSWACGKVHPASVTASSRALGPWSGTGRLPNHRDRALYTVRSSEAKGAAELRCRQLDGRAAILVVARPGGSIWAAPINRLLTRRACVAPTL
jgi:hypothetical protein